MFLDLQNPINRNHPLNKGKVACWLTIPELAGGKFLYDLCGLYPGTLTNMGSGSGWKPTSRPGGRGHLLLDGSDDYVLLTSAYSLIAGLDLHTVALWIKFTAIANSPVFLSNSLTGASRYFFEVNGSNGRFIFGCGDATGNVQYTAGLTTNVWYHVVVVKTAATTASVYVNGLSCPVVLTVGGGIASTPAGAGDLYIGKYTSAGLETSGVVDDVSLYNRALSAGEVFALYNESKLGYPNALNYEDDMLWGSSGGLLLERRRQMLLAA